MVDRELLRDIGWAKVTLKLPKKDDVFSQVMRGIAVLLLQTVMKRAEFSSNLRLNNDDKTIRELTMIESDFNT